MDAGHVSFVQPAEAARENKCVVILAYQRAAPAPMVKECKEWNSAAIDGQEDKTERAVVV
jgi:hypothetical protein